MVAVHQGPRRHAFIQVVVDGDDVTDRLLPFLLSVVVTDKLDKEIDTCVIELDDRNAQLALPQDGSVVKVRMGWSGEGPRIDDPPPPEVTLPELPFGGGGLHLVFVGTIKSVESAGGRSRAGGRRLWIEAEGLGSSDNVKAPNMQSWGVGDPQDNAQQGGEQVKLKTVFEEAAKNAGLEAKVSPSMAAHARDFWSQNESFMSFGTRLASELGGHFKISGGIATLVGADGINADGNAMPTIDAWWGVNLITWRIKPFIGRPQFGQGKNIFFDILKGKHMETLGNIGGSLPFGNANATAQLPGSAPNRQIGDQNNDGIATDSKSGRGTGWATINGEPMARAHGRLRIFGARPGVDGSWRITEAEHNYSRHGYTTRCQLDYPQLDASVYEGMGWKQKGAAAAPAVSARPEQPTPPQVIIEGPATFDERFTFPTETTPVPEVEIGDVQIQGGGT